MNKDELKEQLLAIKNNNWEFPEGLNFFDLSMDMLNNIGSLDLELRDNLIYDAYVKIIKYKRISFSEMKKLLSLCLTDEHLFNGVGKVNDNSVFNRTFTALLIVLIIDKNNEAENPFLSKEEVLKVFHKFMQYYKMEKDYRGYVDVIGWAHSVAHGADVLWSLAESEYLGKDELKEILSVIKDKVCIDTYTYINEEEERLLNAFGAVYRRKILSDDEIVEWILSFDNVFGNDKDNILLPNHEYLRQNCKLFIRALEYRAKELNFNKKILEGIDKVYESIPKYY